MKKKRRISLSVKLNVSAVLFAAVICFFCSLVGYIQTRNSIQKQYNQTAWEIANVAANYLDEEALQVYSIATRDYVKGNLSENERDSIIHSLKYQETRNLLFDLREGMGVNDIYIIYINIPLMNSYQEGMEDWNPLYYIFDCYADESLSYVLGDTGPMNPDFIEYVDRMWETGERTEDFYYISHSAYGYNTSAFVALQDSTGETYALIGVETPMTTIQQALRQYVIFAVLIAVLLCVLLTILYTIYLTRKTIRPINKVSQEALAFVKEDRVPSKELALIKTNDEIETLAQSLLKMENDIVEYIDNITSITREKERIGAELDVARHIQGSMLPGIFPAFPELKEFDLHASMTPAKEVGGDFYDFFLVDDTHLALVMADVSGKGVPAALFMVIAKTLIKNRCQLGESPAEVLMKVNDQLCENNEEGMFVTVWLGLYNLVTGQLDYANAGHEHPAVSRSGQPFSLVKEKANFVLAGMPGMKYQEHSLKLEKGDRLFLYTDGIPEATNESLEAFGEERMIRILNEIDDKSCKTLIDHMKASLDSFKGEAEQFDDITMLALRIDEFKKVQAQFMDTIRVKPNLDNLETLFSFVESCLAKVSCDDKSVNHCTVACDEIFSNIVFYSGADIVEVTCTTEKDRVFISFKDNGVQYDPTKKAEADVTLDADERPIGGLGIHIVRRMMDDVRYEYADGFNVLTLEKRFTPKATH